MENTASLLFNNTDSKYFVAVRGKAVGPLTAQEVYERICKGEFGPLHYFWISEAQDWKRICDEKEFAVLIPQKPSTSSIAHIKEKVFNKKKETLLPALGKKTYYLYYSNSQYGPFSKEELLKVLQTHTVGKNAYLWTAGWSTWKRLTEVEEFSNYVVTQTAPSLKVRVSTRAGKDATDKRKAPRRPLVARLFVHNNKEVIIAVCRDISVGGMQVLTDRVPGEVGSHVKLNVSPGDPKKVKSFVAEGEVVRILEDGRGFSFRFTKITSEARKTIEKYIQE